MDIKNRNLYKYCVVPQCSSTTIKTPNKIFITVPRGEKRKEEWQIAMKKGLSNRSTYFACEDHFDLKNDIENYMKWSMMPGTPILLKTGVTPHKFVCQRKLEITPLNPEVNENGVIVTATTKHAGVFPKTEDVDVNPEYVYVKQEHIDERQEDVDIKPEYVDVKLELFDDDKYFKNQNSVIDFDLSFVKDDDFQYESLYPNNQDETLYFETSNSSNFTQNDYHNVVDGILRDVKNEIEIYENTVDCTGLGIKSEIFDDHIISSNSMKLTSCSRRKAIIKKHKNKYLCAACDKKSSKLLASRQRHMSKQFEEHFVICKICGKIFSNKSEFLNHSSHFVKSSKQRVSVQKAFKCKICSKQFNLESNLTRHIKFHRGQKFKCEICQKLYIQKSNLKTRLRIHKGENKPYKCPQREPLRSHLNTDEDEKSFKCVICHKEYSKKVFLSSHFRSHSCQRPFECEICSKRFLTKSDLDTHLGIHAGEKPFQCEVCSSQFTRKSNLNRHMKSHTGDKPFKCDVCSKEFSRKSGLSTHFRIHTGEKPHKCKICLRAFTDKSSLMRHFKVHGGQ